MSMAKRGRQPMCTPERVEKICKAIANGETQETAFRLAGISKNTCYRWLSENSDFSDAVKKAKEEFSEWEMNGILEDAKKSLKTLICGQEYEEIKTEYEQDPRNPGEPRIRKQTRTIKRIPPNATAIIFALCNRAPGEWSNKHIQELTGKIETETKSGISLANVPDKLLAQVIDAINGK